MTAKTFIPRWTKTKNKPFWFLLFRKIDQKHHKLFSCRMKTLLKEKKLRKKGEEKGPKYTKISISHSSSTADKIAPTLPLPHKILNLNKNHFRQTGSGAPVTYCTICRMQSCNRNSVSSFIPNSSASSFFFSKTKEKRD